MTALLSILCYHRVVTDVTAAWPYLERGTAVHVVTFERHVADLRDRADILGHADAVDVLTGRLALRRPAVWLTFDDGYADTLTTTAPLLVAFDASATAFVTTATLAPDPWLPADRWYRVLLRAERPRGTVDVGMGTIPFDLTTAPGRARLVHGPERIRYLRMPPAAQATILATLAQAVAAPLDDADPPYLRPVDLRELIARGWGVGSHGASHMPLDQLDDDAVAAEATTSRHALVAATGQATDVLALPDGAVPRALAPIHRAGYRCVLGLGDRAVPTSRSDIAPRFIVANDPDWVRRALPRPGPAA